MSDNLYDSLEDECDDGRGSSDPVDPPQTESISVKRVSKLESINRHSSFCFGKNVKKKESDSFPGTKAVPVNASHKNNFLPIINNKDPLPGLQAFFNHSTDSQSLAKKGLLLNCDGSFTKSPRSDAEELPFITREYKNLVFQKQKTYNFKKRSQVKTLKTKRSHDNETSKSDLCCSKLLLDDKKHPDALHKKHSFQENKLGKPSAANDNLTDSMKRMLLHHKNRKNRHQITKETDARPNLKCCSSETRTMKNNYLGSTGTKIKDFNSLNKNLSQFPLNSQKQHLTYLEQLQLRNGYSPLFLRYGVKKATSDTTRSNFGDPMTAKLSEVSSRILSLENVGDSEDEEKFYEEIIERDKMKAVKAQRGNVSGRHLEAAARDSVTGSCSLKELEKLRGSGRMSYKQILKPLFIDLKDDDEHTSNSSKKCSHYCSSNPSPKMSKTELALKGKTYGYLANARNILNFKSRAEEKISGREKSSPKLSNLGFGHRQVSGYKVRGKGNVKKCSGEVGLAKRNKYRFGQSFGQEPDDDGDLTEAEKDEKMFFLPRVDSWEHSDYYTDTRNSMRRNSYLFFPSNKNEDEFIIH